MSRKPRTPPVEVVLLLALSGLAELRPVNWDDGEDPKLTKAYRFADRALERARDDGLSVHGAVVVDGRGETAP